MKKRKTRQNEAGFSILELMISMTIILIVLGLVMSMFARSFGTRQRESSRTDALTAAQAALNVISREIANSGYGLRIAADGVADNGIVIADSGSSPNPPQKIHFRANTMNGNITLTDPGEDVTFYFEPVSQSILRYDANGGGPNVPQTSTIINRISSLSFQYFNYSGANPVPTTTNIPSAQTGRVRVTVTVKLENLAKGLGQATDQDVVLVSDVTLRNSEYMLQQY